METGPQRRKRKLIELIKQHGVRKLAEQANLNWQSLDQIAKGVKNEPRQDGTQTEKNLGNAAARALELAWGLGEGWFDRDDLAHPAPPPTLSQLESLMLVTFRKLESDEDRFEALSRMNAFLTERLNRPGPHDPWHGKPPPAVIRDQPPKSTERFIGIPLKRPKKSKEEE